MDVIKKMKPGEPGTKRLHHQYGDRLLCVRYRGDAKQRRRITTVELIIDEGFYYVPSSVEKKQHSLNANRNVHLRVNYDETELRKQIKSVGARWQPEHKRWLIRYREAVKLNLQDRIEEIEM